ncbi:hypothetical protein [Sphingobium jiangsuense]|uniref:hypothetical protein n=1 Tax=Sphingobium jiangsuense TaxID=870476 RepID=UPI001CB6B8D3|nr:hypothetical protein [Sphingobium jiangsuense]
MLADVDAVFARIAEIFVPMTVMVVPFLLSWIAAEGAVATSSPITVTGRKDLGATRQNFPAGFCRAVADHADTRNARARDAEETAEAADFLTGKAPVNDDFAGGASASFP